MRLDRERHMSYVLMTNAEDVEFMENHNYWEDMHKKNCFDYIGPRGNILPHIGEGERISFIGDKSCMNTIIQNSYKVYRIVPYEITARSYWGEFRRKSYYTRHHKVIFHETSIIFECLSEFPDTDRTYQTEFKGYQPQYLHPNDMHRPFGGAVGNARTTKFWNLTRERVLGPNFADYSTNDCFKYYTLLL